MLPVLGRISFWKLPEMPPNFNEFCSVLKILNLQEISLLSVLS